MEALPILYHSILSILKNPLSKSMTVLGEAFVADLILRTSKPKALNVAEIEGKQTFYGYPDNDFVYQIATVLHLWAVKGKFPIHFVHETFFADQTPIILESLNIFTEEIKAVDELLSKSGVSSEAETAVDKLLAGIGIRGILTMMGVRKTVGSADMIIPHKEVLEEKFNKPHIVLSEEELKKKKSIPKLSVGGKALSKHAHRSSEGFWGEAKGPELEKNAQAAEILDKILKGATWINIHGLPHNEFILEVLLGNANKKLVPTEGRIWDSLAC
eukprot:TRINITY_DN135825_c0_g1_i1.p3 TRINITY_DN135825_c0_g1~~TRINITY_DN135825_c0_g1_i1.p3  ORF type:complete len:297 (-),score=32.02 TRINITY_DN135825_c0_g1_i1:5049-5864(-)